MHQLGKLIMIPHRHHRPIKLPETTLPPQSPQEAIPESRLLAKFGHRQQVIFLQRIATLAVVASVKDVNCTRAQVELRHFKDGSTAGDESIVSI